LKGMGTQFDPEIVRAFIEVRDDTWTSLAKSVEADLSVPLKSKTWQAATETVRLRLQLVN
jgi:hypothetical protein